MGRFVIVILLLLPALIVNAQFDQRTLYCSGFGTYSYQKYDGSTEYNKQRAILGNVVVGFFPAKKLMIGITSGVFALKDESKTVYETSAYILTEVTEKKSSSFNLGPIARYYIVRGLYCETNFVAGKSKMIENYESYRVIGADLFEGLTWEKESKSNVIGFTAGIGYSIFIGSSKHIAVDVSLAYQQQNLSDIKYSGIAAGFGISGFIFRHKQNINE